MLKMANKSEHWFSMIGLVFGCVLFGMGSLIVAHIETLGGFAMAFWRLLVSAPIFLLLSFIFKQSFPKNRHALKFAILAGAVLGLDLALWHESIYAVGPGISTLLNSLQIFFLAFISFWWFKERQTNIQILGLILASVGVALIASPEFKHNQSALWGFIWGILSGLCLAVSMAFIRRAHEMASIPLFPMMGVIGISGATALLPIMLIVDSGKIIPVGIYDIFWIVIYGTLMQCVAWGLIAYSIPKIALTLTGLLLLSEPVAALLIDYFWLAKPINLMQWWGVFLVMLAIYLGSYKPKTK